MDPPAPLPSFVSEAANSSSSTASDFVKQTDFVSAIPPDNIAAPTQQVPPKDLKIENDLEKSVANALSPITQVSYKYWKLKPKIMKYL